MSEAKQNSFSKYIDFFTVLLSASALIIAVRSCQISDQSLEIERNRFKSATNTIWNFELSENGQYFNLKPSNKSVTLLEVQYYYPNLLDPNVQVTNDSKFFIKDLITELQSQTSILIKEENKVIDEIIGIEIPISIGSEYSINGINFYDRSLYNLNCICRITDKLEIEKIKVIYKVYFKNLIPEPDKDQDLLDELWLDEYKKITLLIKNAKAIA